jgi:SPX domain protein involved in polyphosphate accumulation
MYDNHFQRVEEKYLITSDKKEEFLKKTSDYLKKDKFFASEIHNIYFDTKDSNLIIHSLEKPIFKDKFRVRSYGLPSLNDYVFLEMKTKYNGVVGKRRIKLTLKEFNDYIENHKMNNSQIFQEIDYYFQYYQLKPTIYIAYDRHSYQGNDDKNLRITFDSNLRSRRDNLTFCENTKMFPYFQEDFYIMEIKTIGSMPLWLVRILSEMNIMPTSFSKYGKIYEKEMLNYA